MVEQIDIDGQSYRKRRPLVVLVLTVSTLLVYWVIYHYKINDEARRFLRDPSIKPSRSVLAIVPGFLLLVPPIVSIYRTGLRVGRMQTQAGIAKTINPILGCVCAVLTATTFVFAGGTGYYFQTQLNKVWTAATADPHTSRQ
jgi:hypothetical protein